MTPVRIFIDFWNHDLQWRERCTTGRCDWTKLPSVLVSAAEACAPQLGPLKLDDTRVYASTNPEREGGLTTFLENFLNRQPGFRVFIRKRRSRATPAHCRNCGTSTPNCPSCKKAFMKASEKGVDTAIVTDMFSLAWEGAYQVAILVSGDADLIPAVEKIQDKGQRILNATWDNYGHELAKVCWASFSLDPFIASLVRPDPKAASMPADPKKITGPVEVKKK